MAFSMVQDHQKASQEVSQLASRDGLKLPNQLSGKAKDKHDTFSKLGGKDFDQAYMTYMLRDHMMDVTEFEEGVKTLQDPAVKQWASGALPVLKEHLQKAKTIARSLGIDDQHAR